MLVSGYFKLLHNKTRSLGQYAVWIPQFLQNTPSHITFFTTPDLLDEFKAMRPSEYPTTWVTYDSVYEIETIKKYGFEFWVEQNKRDPETYHCPELVAIWSNVPEFCLRAAEIHGLDEPYIWVSAGCVRDPVLYPYLKTFGTNFSMIPKDKLLLQSIHTLPKNFKYFVYDDVYIAAGLSAGYPSSWKKCLKNYYDMIDEYVQADVPVTMDQYIWASCAQKYPENYEIVKTPDRSCEAFTWFYFIKYLA